VRLHHRGPAAAPNSEKGQGEREKEEKEEEQVLESKMATKRGVSHMETRATLNRWIMNEWKNGRWADASRRRRVSPPTDHFSIHS